jgi:hypothetical protein
MRIKYISWSFLLYMTISITTWFLFMFYPDNFFLKYFIYLGFCMGILYLIDSCLKFRDENKKNFRPCHPCNGNGFIVINYLHHHSGVYKCFDCNGSGYFWE